LHFNLTKAELFDNLDLEKELTKLRNMFEGDVRKLGTAEIKAVLELVKRFMRLSYGIRSEDGKRFSKNPEKWIEFTETAGYDAFLLSLFEKPEKAIEFMTGVMPADLVNQAMAELEKDKAKNAAKRSIQEQGARYEASQAAKDAEPTPAVRAIDEIHPIQGSHIQSAPDIAGYTPTPGTLQVAPAPTPEQIAAYLASQPQETTQSDVH
jgi:hypothetical protein